MTRGHKDIAERHEVQSGRIRTDGSCWWQVRCTTMRTNGQRPGESEEDERSGAKGDGKCTGDSRGRSATDGYRVFVGFLVPGDSQSTNPRAQSGDRDALGSATGARTHERRQDIRDA